jgi:hypothetical protein
MNELDHIQDTLKHLSKREDADKLLETVNVIVNMLNEVGYELKGAKYEKTFTHGEFLKIKVTYGKQ